MLRQEKKKKSEGGWNLKECQRKTGRTESLNRKGVEEARPRKDRTLEKGGKIALTREKSCPYCEPGKEKRNRWKKVLRGQLGRKKVLNSGVIEDSLR